MRSGMAARFPTDDEDTAGRPRTNGEGNEGEDPLIAFIREIVAENITSSDPDLHVLGGYSSALGPAVSTPTVFPNDPTQIIGELPQTGPPQMLQSQGFQETALEQDSMTWSNLGIGSEVTVPGISTEAYTNQHNVQDGAWLANPPFPLDPGLQIPSSSAQKQELAHFGQTLAPYHPVPVPVPVPEPSYVAQSSYSVYQSSGSRPGQHTRTAPSATITRPPDLDQRSTAPEQMTVTLGYSQGSPHFQQVQSEPIVHSIQPSSDFGSSVSQESFLAPSPSPMISQVLVSLPSSTNQMAVPSAPKRTLLEITEQSKVPTSQHSPSQIKEMRKTIVRYAINVPNTSQELHASTTSSTVSHRRKSPLVPMHTSPSPPRAFVFPPRPELMDASRRGSSYSPGNISSSPQISPVSTLSPTPSAYSTDRTSESQSETVRERLLETIQRRRGSVNYEEAEALDSGNQDMTPEERVKKAKRREQNRRAAQRCRQKKKQAADSVVGEFRKLQSCNTSLRQEIKKLSKQKDQLTKTLKDHLPECSWTSAQRSASAGRASVRTSGLGAGPLTAPTSDVRDVAEDLDDEDSSDDTDTSDDDDDDDT